MHKTILEKLLKTSIFQLSICLIGLGIINPSSADPITGTWTCSGTMATGNQFRSDQCGTFSGGSFSDSNGTYSSGDVSIPTGASSYQWLVTTNQTSSGQIDTNNTGALPASLTGMDYCTDNSISTSQCPSTGTTLTSSTFSVGSQGGELSFDFDYITSDSSPYNDYGWGGLFNTNGDLVALLFTARTPTDADTNMVPGHDLPEVSSGVTLTPQTTIITPGTAKVANPFFQGTSINGAPNWAPISGDGFIANDNSIYRCNSDSSNNTCGSTGWITASLENLAPGDYYLEFGVVNWTNPSFQSGLAIANVDISMGTNEGSSIPEPITLSLIVLGLFGIGYFSNRENRKIQPAYS
ncbi:NF038132 family protein [Candidatus Nitrosacidococcus tergens]|uniref:PEP-CTERM protein-sorting domain-containing protein n=1 Tax=Candidatus Nitrosacidococcus tergens TaxID=553981 RepID=A0A7G1Q943_9GAMM|nr:NF038132 family protein [Candidatus Nitrosacidococcus tergens]CAB1275189.1 protein of unknown function [Candidatus Nitrosacidococcus tergens]